MIRRNSFDHFADNKKNKPAVNSMDEKEETTEISENRPAQKNSMALLLNEISKYETSLSATQDSSDSVLSLFFNYWVEF